MIGEAVYSDGEIIEYDLETDASSVYLSLFERSATDLDVNAVSTFVPEPSGSLLLVIALVAVGLPGPRRRSRPRSL